MHDVLGPLDQPRATMLRSHNMRCRVGATLVRVMLAGIALLAAASLTITGPWNAAWACAGPRTPQAQPGQRVPAMEQVVAAHAAARGWLDRFETPSLSASQSHVPIDGCSAVCVILRRHGRVMGAGIDSAGDDLMLRRAVGRAMNQVLADPALQAVAASLRRADDADDEHVGEDQPPPPRLDPQAEARIESLRKDLGRSLTLEIEAAGELIPLVGRTLQQMAGKIEVGIDGLAIRRANEWSYQFPSQMRTTNTLGEPERMLRNLAISAGLPMSELGEAGARADTSFYRFRSVNLAQTSPDAPPIELFRGDVLVKSEDVTREQVARLADGIAQHMLANLWPDPPAPPPDQPPLPRLPMGARGDYSPAADQHQPDFAPPVEQALCGWALVRYATCSDAAREQAGLAVEAAVRVLRDLADVHPRERDPRDDPGACAVLLYIAADTPSMLSDAKVGELIRTAAQRVFRSFDAEPEQQGAARAKGFQWLMRAEDGGVTGQSLSPLSQAMLAGAMARVLAAKVGELALGDAATSLAAAEAAWSAAPEPDRVALLPWIGWAFVDLARASGSPLQHAQDLRAMRETLERVRLACDPATAGACAPDLDGGFALTGEDGGDAHATAQSLRPALWLCTAIRDERLTQPEELEQSWTGHLRTMRFIMQLAAGDAQAAMVRSRDRTGGGVCSSLWDNRQPVAAQALGLLTAVETLKAWPASKAP